MSKTIFEKGANYSLTGNRIVSDNFIERCLDWRGIEPEDVCNDCGGPGYKAYPSTSTWRGSVGGQMITTDVCNWCWGSGNKNRRWPKWER